MNQALKHDYEVIIIGCGIAGATAGALLAKAGKKVLVIEQSSQVGGRTVSLRGEGIESKSKVNKLLKEAAHTWFTDRCEPSLDEIIARGMLNGYVLESGARGSWMTNRGCVSYAMQHFNKPSIFYPNVGFVMIEENGKANEIIPGKPLGWMTDEDYQEMLKIEMALRSVKTITEAEKYDFIDLKSWMEQYTKNEKALEFQSNRCTYHTVINDPALNTVGENMKVIQVIQASGTSLVHGGWGFAGAPGHRFLVEGLVASIEEYGGEIITGAKVEEILIENDVAKGVRVQIGEAEFIVKSNVVLCTLMPKLIPKLMAQEKLETDFQIAIERTIGAGVITAYMGLKQPITDFIKETKVDPRSFLWSPVIAKAEEGFRGDVPVVGANVSSIAPTRAPEGKHLAVWAANVLDEEASDPAKVNLIIDRLGEFFDRAFPGWHASLDWITFGVTETALCWRYPNDPKPDITCKINGLYFAGDAYGKSVFCGGIEAASYSGMIAAEKITGKNFRTQILPEIYW